MHRVSDLWRISPAAAVDLAVDARDSEGRNYLEEGANVVVGYGVAGLVQVLLFPMFVLAVTFGQPRDGLVFTVVSIAPSYLLRRAFDAWR